MEDNLTTEEILKPIYASKKENWAKADYIGIEPQTLQKFKSREMLKVYVYADIYHYAFMHSFRKLVVTKEYMANYLRISEEELDLALSDLMDEKQISLKHLDDDFISLWPVW